MPKIQIRRDTFDNWKAANPTLLSGEWALETDTNRVKIGDGTTAYNDLECFKESDNEWLKPADWIDIRSGALPNSVYFLVGHSNPVETGESTGEYVVDTYPLFSVYAEVSNSGTYDVVVDGNKVATTASGTATTLDWADLYEKGTVRSGWDVTYPAALHTHVVRVTPSVGTNTITKVCRNTSENSAFAGVLWIHFTLTNSIILASLLGVYTSASAVTSICEAITASSNVLTVSGSCTGTFRAPLKNLPVIDLNSETHVALNTFTGCNLSKIHIKNGQVYGYSTFQNCEQLKEIVGENFFIQPSSSMFSNCSKLQNIPGIATTGLYTTNNNYTTLSVSDVFHACTSLKDTHVDLTNYNFLKLLKLGGKSATPLTGVNSLVVSQEAPFDNATTPQLDVSYTGLDRNALVRLFKSMPYNVGYTLSGNATVTDGVLGNLDTDSSCMLSVLPTNFTTIEFLFNVKKTTSGYLPICSFGKANANKRLNGKEGDGHILYADGSTHIVELSNSVFDYSTAREQVNGYYIKLLVTKNTSDYTYSLSGSMDGTTWTEPSSANYETNICSGVVSLLRSSSGAGAGGTTMNLNNSYIKVNGVTWFNGAYAVSQRVPSSDLTVVGSPTISNGVASNFGTSDYLRITASFSPNTSDFKIGTEVKTGSISSNQRIISDGKVSENSNGLIFSATNKNFRFKVYDSTSSQHYEVVSSVTVSANSNYAIQAYRQGTTLAISVSTDGTNWTTDTIDLPETASFSNIALLIGNARGFIFYGSINLNNTYIKVNGSVWMHGTDPLTKTIDIRNTTGESALSSDDKNIVLSKGWALTTNNDN